MEPVNGLDRVARTKACKAGIGPLSDRIRPLAPQAVVIIGYGVFDDVSQALTLAGHADVERHGLPFPMTRPRASDGVPYRRVYVDELAALVAGWRESGLIGG